jgi:hypothetical protein
MSQQAAYAFRRRNDAAAVNMSIQHQLLEKSAIF